MIISPSWFMGTLFSHGLSFSFFLVRVFLHSQETVETVIELAPVNIFPMDESVGSFCDAS